MVRVYPPPPEWRPLRRSVRIMQECFLGVPSFVFLGVGPGEFQTAGLSGLMKLTNIWPFQLVCIPCSNSLQDCLNRFEHRIEAFENLYTDIHNLCRNNTSVSPTTPTGSTTFPLHFPERLENLTIQMIITGVMFADTFS